MPNRIFRLIKLLRSRRVSAGVDSPPSDLQPGEIAVGENEGVLYYGKADGSIITLTGSSGAGAVQSVAGRTGIVTLTKIDVGLSNVDNTADANKPVSTATQTALDLKAPIASPTFTGNVGGITKGMVGLGNVDNTADANKPVSTATQTALDLKAPINAPIFSLGALSGTNAIDFDDDRLFQTLTLNGSAVTFIKGIGWPTTNITADVILRITVTAATTITWTVVTDWFTQPPAGDLSIGTHLFLLRAVGASIIEGHYIGSKTN